MAQQKNRPHLGFADMYVGSFGYLHWVFNIPDFFLICFTLISQRGRNPSFSHFRFLHLAHEWVLNPSANFDRNRFKYPDGKAVKRRFQAGPRCPWSHRLQTWGFSSSGPSCSGNPGVPVATLGAVSDPHPA